ncbi:MAG: Anaphase-promoting complex subunit 1 [Thelocarpon superellum]|nr:MAG: Anaphase-promoting complex subunit 1 [Thelocarpon superellum]
MASVTSLGLHHPTALPYLIEEGLLPAEPSADRYRWTTFLGGEKADEAEEEELLVTETCVVWSQRGLVRKVFRFEVENEAVAHAVLTRFPTHESSRHWSTTETSSTAAPSPTDPSDADGGLSRAVVVFLQTQAHVYFLSGASHVVHLPFEVDRVLPVSRGLFIQRKLPSTLATPASAPFMGPPPGAPPNSLASSRLPSSQAEVASFTGGHTGPDGLDLVPGPAPLDRGHDIPRSFCLTDPLLEMGLVVTAETLPRARSTTARGPGQGSSRLEDLHPAEELVYISPASELASFGPNDPLLLALTVNEQTKKYTLWHVSYLEPESAATLSKYRTASASGAASRRRSSFGHGATTGTTTPAGFGGTATRDSLGAASHPDAGALLAETVEDDALVSSLNVDLAFAGGGGPAKESRRVSSLLARADLSTTQDKVAFSDLATGHAASSSAVHPGASRRGESLGSVGVGGRSSFGASAGGQRRGSTPVGRHHLSGHDGNASQVPVDDLLEELNAGGSFEGFEHMGLHDPVGGLRKEIVMKKMETWPRGAPVDGALEDTGLHKKATKVFTLVPPPSATSSASLAASVVMAVMDPQSKTLVMVTIHLKHPRAAARRQYGSLQSRQAPADRTKRTVVPTLGEVWRGTGVLDAAKIVDRTLSRLLVLRQTDDGHGELSLRGLAGEAIRVDLPPHLAVFDLYRLGAGAAGAARRDGGLRRVFRKGRRVLRGLEHGGTDGDVDVLDEQGHRHRLKIQLRARQGHIGQMLDICRCILPGRERGGDGVLTGWWEVRRWLRDRGTTGQDDEWTALVVLLMVMAVPFVPNRDERPAVNTPTRRTGLLRSSSGAHLDLESWTTMLSYDGRHGSPGPAWMSSPAWRWVAEEAEDEPAVSFPDSKRRSRASWTTGARSFPPAATTSALNQKNSFLLDCVGWARDFLRSSAGKAATGDRGYLPTARGRHAGCRRTALPTILVGLHLFREELKLDVTTADAPDSDVARLTPVLAQIGGWLGWREWSGRTPSYYSAEDVAMDRWLFNDGLITQLDVPDPPFPPPSIYDWCSACAQPVAPAPFTTLPDLVDVGPRTNRPSTMPEFWRTLTPRTPILIDLFLHMHVAGLSSAGLVQKMADLGVGKPLLDTLPEGIVAPLLEAMVNCQADPPTSWNAAMLELIGREDLRLLLSPLDEPAESARPQSIPTHEAARDVHTICSTTFDAEPSGSVEGAAEMDRQAITRLIFRDDRRFAEAARLVQSSRTSVARCAPEPDWTEADLLEAQKEVAQTVAMRTLAVPAGRGPLSFRARHPLLTERFPIPGFNLSCVMRPSHNTVSADKSSFTEEKVGWAFFHAGVAAGLSIARDATGIDASWIVFNKPAELSNRHAGFLLALGLNGHLKALAKWVAFKYLTPKHTMTSIGLLLGLSASYLGTMDTLVTKLLSVHVSRMLPPGAAELNLSPLTQTTGIMGLGLLYCQTQHRRMSEVMLSEIEHIDEEDASTPSDAVRDEGYRLAAGFALGLINLGKGQDLKGLHDMHLVERLLGIAVGTKKVSIVHVLDKSTAAATMATALIFMKSHDAAVARKIDVPDTLVQFDYVRPDLFLLRTVARHLIMWHDMRPTARWIREHVPRAFQHRATLREIHSLRSEDLPFFNIVAGLCFSLALRHAGSGSLEVRDMLRPYLDQYIRLCRLPAVNYDQKLTRSTVRNCQDLLALSCATVMAGTGDLAVFRRLRSLHGRTDPETPYGSHLAAHVAIGVLFLGGGTYTFGTTPLATAALLCAFYPLFPNAILDNKSHLQAFRHFWALAVEARCIVAREADSSRPVSIPLSISLRAGPVLRRTAPCLLPPLDEVRSIATASPDHWRVVLDFARNPAHLAAFERSQTILVRQHAAYDASASVFRTTLRALHDTETARHPLEWLLDLSIFQTFDRAERALVLPPDAATGAGGAASASSAALDMESALVDARLIFEHASLDEGKADRLRNLKCLFDWADRADRERREHARHTERGGEAAKGEEEAGEGEGGEREDTGRRQRKEREDGVHRRWITPEVIDRLRARVWLACQSEE